MVCHHVRYYSNSTKCGSTTIFDDTKEEGNYMNEETSKSLKKKQVHEILLARIQQLCKENGMSYYSLSYKASLPLNTIINIVEGNTKNPGIYTIMKMCDGFGITMKEFFDTEEFDAAIAESRDEK